MTAKNGKAPPHLAATTRAWWAHVAASYELEQHHSRLLTRAAEAWDRGEQARATVAKDGAFYVNRFGEPRPHPALAVQRDAEISFARLLRELALDVPVPDARPPRTGGHHAR